MVKGNAYGCGIGPITGALAKTGCKTFFVSNIPEAKRVRAVAPISTIYVLNGLYSGTEPAFAEVNARPVINNSVEMAEWDVFVRSHQWTGGCALNVDTGASRLGLSCPEKRSPTTLAALQNGALDWRWFRSDMLMAIRDRKLLSATSYKRSSAVGAVQWLGVPRWIYYR